MGSYINYIDKVQMHAPAEHKAQVLLNAGAQEIEQPTEFKENLVCVVDNGMFGAAGYAYSEKEFKAFSPTENDDRPRRWFIFDRAKEFANPKYWEKK